MKRFLMNDAIEMYQEVRKSKPTTTNRLPHAFAGRTTPTRVAWRIVQGYCVKPVVVAENPNSGTPQHVQHIPTRFKVYQYCGKPNRYRALQALRLLASRRLFASWQLEFDAAGVLAWRSSAVGRKKTGGTTMAYLAYHPHSATADVIAEFAKPTWVKRIGKLGVYSHAKKLSVEKLDAYYEWFEKSFAKKLKRPKQTPMEVESADAEV